MSRSAGVSIENNFRNALVTEATGLNFPENACTDTLDCVFNFDGSVERRAGWNFEDNFDTKTINRSNSVVSTFLWKNVAGDGDVSVVVVQVGATLYFYRVESGQALSVGAVADTVALTSVSGAPTAETIECQFATGNGLLFVTHPYIEPMRITYNTATDDATATNITLKIRDFEGDTADTEAVDTRVTATLAGLNVSHRYNLQNQGWTTTNLTAWDTAQTTMPAHCDVMWAFKNATDDFTFDATVLARNPVTNSPAPKGHFILTLSSGDRDAVSGLSGTTDSGTSFYRPTTCAFFAGRVFYSGITYGQFNSKIYFTQIVERPEQYGFAYQQNDPTAETAFDLLPSDGGVIAIPEAGTIIKLVSVTGGLVVFSQNGVWFITGSTGIGFTADDYTVQKISTVPTLSASSFIDVNGMPSWWATEGIYVLQIENTSPIVKPITFESIKSYYDAIPKACKQNARGVFNYITGVGQWLFRSEAGETPTEDYAYDNVLNWNAVTGAFYPWTIPTHDVTVNSIILLDTTIGGVNVLSVIDDSANDVIDDSANSVIAFEASNAAVVPGMTFLVSYEEAGSWEVTFAGANNTDYIDWFSYDDIGTDYTSYFVTGYKLRGDAIRKWQNNWLRIYSRNEVDTSYQIQGLWDYALANSTNRWSDAQTLTHLADNYSHRSKRVKIRGHGQALQFKVTSVTGVPFSIVGWAGFDTANGIP
jgi:hypothetical protein